MRFPLVVWARPLPAVLDIVLAVLFAAVLVTPSPGWAQDSPPTPVVDRESSNSGELLKFGPAPESIEIALNKARQIILPSPVRDVIVPNPAIADVIVKTPTQIYLVAKKVGDTNIFFIGRDGNVIRHLAVRVDIELDGVRKSIRALLPNAKIELRGVNGAIVLGGIVRSAAESADAVAVARRFVKSDDQVINMLKILADQQVLLKMRIAEVQRNVLKTLGATTSFSRTRGGRTFTLDTTGVAASSFVSAVIPINKLGFNTATITALERRGLVKTLAEPALIAISGETANFLAGGEFPVPTGSDADGTVRITFKPFGVSLSFTPVVLANGQISLRIKTEVSRLSTENQVVLSGTTIPGLTVRRADSTVTLNSGDSLMIAGLLKSEEFNTIDGVPWLKDLPILGALFRSQSFQNDQTELVVMLTVFLVRPVEPGLRLTSPTDGLVSSSDFDMYLMGRLYKRYSKRKTLPEIRLPKGPVGYIMQ